ncbi:uncharacterized protein moto isoform X2 [Corythoichthys intestinalis]|nr:uncharacterized protein moto isoform X2 [Corythoichthys intestinalis]
MAGLWAQEEGVPEFKLWSSNGHGDPYELRNCTRNSILGRDCIAKYELEEDEDDDLQGLVSSILDEGDDNESGFYKVGNTPNVNGIWSPKSLRDDDFQYSQSEETLPNFVRSSFIQSQVESNNESLFQRFSGIPANPYWPICVPNGDADDLNRHPKRSPPGLPIPQRGKQFPPQTRPSKYDVSSNMHLAYNCPVNDLPQINGVAQLQNKMSRPKRDLNESAMSAKRIGKNAQEHMNQLVSGLQSVLADESDQGRYGCFPSMEGKTEYPEDSILEHWKFPSQAMPMFREKQLEGEIWGQNVTPVSKHNNLQEIFMMVNENAEYCPQKSFSGTLNPPKQYQYFIERNQYLNPLSDYKIQSQMQKETKMRDNLREWPQTTARVAETKLRPHIDQLGSIERFQGDNIMDNWFIPPAYLDSYPRRFTQLPVKSQKDTNLLGKGPPVFTPIAWMNVNGGATPLYSHLKGSETPSGGGCCTDGDSAPATSLDENLEGFVTQFSFYLEECSEQLEYLEGERKKIGVLLAVSYPCEWTPPPTFSVGLPTKPARVDCLIVNQRKEQANVEWLLHKMERVCKVPLHTNVRLALNSHHLALSCVQVRRREELANSSKHQWRGAPLREDRDYFLSVMALKDLTMTTKKLRTGIWCALQTTLPIPIRRPEDLPDASREEIHTESSPDPFTL